ncbi:eCIS core domain-containing protein [Baaleninema simplex]|uniref:eCIS core domain-containing protein n=1 Tax=Baaleninema simplex TaxID=2862350 RepID=UPI0006886CDF|nr:DUF4157 domain-containing protein [Baaleninema simplex]
MGDQSQIFRKPSSAVQPRTWAKQKENERSGDRAIDPFGWQSQKSAAAGATLPTGGFSILDSPMPVQARLQRQEEEGAEAEGLQVQAKCDRCEAKDRQIQAKAEPGNVLEESEPDLGSLGQLMKMPDSLTEEETVQRQELDSTEENTELQAKVETETNDTELQAHAETSDLAEEKTVQRQELDSTEEDTELQAKTLQLQDESETNKDLDLQTKLTVGKPGDKYEREADSTAAQVMKMSEPMPEEETVQRETTGEEEKDISVQTKPLASQISQGVQLKGGRKLNKGKASNGFEQTLKQQQGQGNPIPNETREFMESRFGADFSGVRVHTDTASVQMNREVGAKAFTHGQDVFFNAGRFNPGSSSGRELLAHELTHTVQQTGGKLRTKTKAKVDRATQTNQVKSRRSESDRLAKTEKAKAEANSGVKNKIETDDSKENKKQLKVGKNNLLKEGQGNSGEKKGQKEAAPGAKAGKEKTQEANATQTPSTVDPQLAQLGAELGQKQTQADQQGSLASAVANKAASGGGASGGGAASAAQQASGGGQANVNAAANTAKSEEVDEKSEAEAIQKRMREAASDDDNSTQLSPGEKSVAMAELASATAPAGATGGGGGGGSAIEAKPAPPAPNVANSEPEAALSAIASLPPAQIKASLGGVGSAIANTANKEREALAAEPPQLETPDGKEMSVAEKEVPQGEEAQPVEKAPEKAEVPVPQPEPTPAAPPSPPIAASAPPIAGDEEGKLSESDVQNLQSSVSQIPTRDPSPPACSAGTAPPLKMQGNADPQQTQEQKAEVEKSAADARLKGEQEAAQPMGEDELYSTLPTEMLTAQTTAQGAGGDAAAIAEGASAQVADMAGGVDAASIIAQEEKGAEIQAAIAQAQGGIANERAQHQAKVAEEEAKSSQQIELLKQENAAQQDAERTRAQGEVEQLRGEWTQEQEAMVAEARSESDVLVSDGLAEVESERLTAESEATQEIQKGEENAEAERVKGEENAAKEKAAGEEKSKGFFGKVADAVGSVFEGIKNAIKAAIDKARQLMCAAIDAAKKLATAAIERGRKAIVGVIKRVGEGLIAVGDRLLAKFPETRDRFRNTIQEKVQQAEDAVNKLAEDLNNGIQEALDLLATGLDAALGLMEAGMLAVVDTVAGAVDGALQFAENVVATAGQFAAIIPDIAANPGQWVSNMAAGAEDGVQNHLWNAFQAQTREWFSGKVTSILGVAPETIQQLVSGGITMQDIVQKAWDAIKVAIPAALIALVIEKVVSMIVPAIGAIKTIIEGLMAAWGSAGAILAAFDAFLGFLKAVKGGSSGPLFAGVLAAAGIAVIDFVATWLIKRLKKAAKMFSAKMKGIAKGIGKKGKRNKDKKKGESQREDSKGTSKNKDKDKDKDEDDDEKEETSAEKKKRLDRGLSAAESTINRRFGSKDAEQSEVAAALAPIKRKHKLKILKPVKQGQRWGVYGKVNPEGTRSTSANVLASRDYDSMTPEQRSMTPQEWREWDRQERIKRSNSPEKLSFSRTSANHANDVSKQGVPTRPYVNSPLTLGEIVGAGNARPDPQGVPGALRWDAPGSFRGSDGVWELVIDQKNKKVLHYNFTKPKKNNPKKQAKKNK